MSEQDFCPECGTPDEGDEPCGHWEWKEECLQEKLREVRDALENAAPDDGSLLNAREVVFSAWLDKQIEVKDE